MTMLLIDTSSDTIFLSLAKEGQIGSICALPSEKNLSKLLMPSIRSLLSSHHRPDYIAIGTGPGSFTGTRVGAMTAQVLAYGWNIPLIRFSSSLLPDLPLIALETHKKFLEKQFDERIELVYLSANL